MSSGTLFWLLVIPAVVGCLGIMACAVSLALSAEIWDWRSGSSAGVSE
jgi:hypothetical protein